MNVSRSEPTIVDHYLPRVLLAHDDPNIRSLLSTALWTDGYQVTEACDGRQALDDLTTMMLAKASSLPDAMVTAMTLPGISGMALLAGVRRMGWALPVVVIMGEGDAENTRLTAEELGADEVIDSACDLEDLRVALTRALLRRPCSQYFTGNRRLRVA